MSYFETQLSAARAFRALSDAAQPLALDEPDYALVDAYEVALEWIAEYSDDPAAYVIARAALGLEEV